MVIADLISSPMAKSYGIIDWNQEAEAIINDVSQFVNRIDLSNINCQNGRDEKLHIYINLETKEGNQYTICLDALGLRICSNQFDHDEERLKTINCTSRQTNGPGLLKPEPHPETYETIYALLSSKSPEYRIDFASELANKIGALNGKDT